MEFVLVVLGLAAVAALAYRAGRAAARPSVRSSERDADAHRLEALGSFAGGIAHDLNNLLTAVFGYTDVVRGTLPPRHDAHEALDLVEEAARRATLVTRSLSTFDLRTEPRRAPLDLAALLADGSGLLGRALPSRIALEGARAEAAWIEGDALSLQALLFEVALVARHLVAGAGTLSVALAPGADGTALLAFRVLGAGEPLVAAEREAALATLSGGGGLRPLDRALAVARAHGARVERGGGDERELAFTLAFPRVAAPRRTAAKKAEAAPVQDELILLAGSDEYVRSLMDSSLRAAGFRVVVARDGAEAVAAFGEHRREVKLVVLDFDAPGRDGLSCLREIRASEPSLPAIVTTGDPDADLTETPPSRVLRKPFLMSELTTLAGELVDGGTPA